MNKNLLKRTVNFRGSTAGASPSLSLGSFPLQLPTSEDLEFGYLRKKAILLVYRSLQGGQGQVLEFGDKGQPGTVKRAPLTEYVVYASMKKRQTGEERRI